MTSAADPRQAMAMIGAIFAICSCCSIDSKP
jgi:hypothetical protein